MAFIQALKRIIKDEWLEPTTFLRESGQTKCKWVQLQFKGQRAIFRHPHPSGSGNISFEFFKDVTHLKKMCDSIVFLDENANNIVYILCCELKSDNYGVSLAQFKAADLLAKFIFDSAKRLCSQSDPLCGYINNLKVEIRFVRFTSKPDKPTVKSGKCKYYNEGPLLVRDEYCETNYSVQDFCC